MHSEPMNPNEAIHPEESQRQALNAELDAQLDAKIIQALEQQPEFTIPTGFAARVASQVPARIPVARRAVLLRSTHYGQWTMLASAVVLAIALIALVTNHYEHTAMGLAMEWIIYAQLLLLCVWLSLRRAGMNWSFRAGK